jgi:sugar lactone lactonase YvrE
VAAVIVRAWVLDVVAGELGGEGNADGAGADARFNYPRAVVSDGKGNLYVADYANTIRQVAIDTGAVTTLAGTPRLWGADNGIGPAARFNQPGGLALDGTGLFIGDTANYTIRMLDLGTGRVTIVAGQPGKNGNVDSSAGIEKFDMPMGLAFDGSGNLYVADAGNDAIRKISFALPNHFAPWVTTLRDANQKALQFWYPQGLAYDGNNTLYAANGDSGTVSRVTLGSPPTTTDLTDGTGTMLQLGSPFSVALDAAGRLYVSEDVDPYPLVSFMPGTGTLTTLTDGVSVPFGITPGGGGNLYVVDDSTVGTIATSANMGAVTTLAGRAAHPGTADGPATTARFSGPTAMVYDGAFAAYVLDASNRTIRKLDLATGEVTTVAVIKRGRLAFRPPSALACDGRWNLYTIDVDLPVVYSIHKIGIATGEVTTVFAGDKSTGSLSSLTADDAGYLYAGNRNSIVRVTIANGELKTIAGNPGVPGKTDTKDGQALFGAVQALTWDGADTLYVADNSAIRKVTISDGTTTTLAGVADQPGNRDGTGPGARFGSPAALAVDPATGTLLVADSTYSTVRRLDLGSGAVSTWIGAPSVGIVRPGPLPATVNDIGGMAFVGHGEILLTDTNENAVLRVH